jgi:hypothetical protein
MGGSGTTNYFPIFTGTSSIGNSVVYQSGSNVGIGTTSPTAKLTVVKDGVGAVSILTGNSGSPTDIGIGRTASEARLGIAANAGHYSGSADIGDAVLRVDSPSRKLHLQAGLGDSVLTVTNSNVGIGTNSPSYKLDITGSLNLNKGLSGVALNVNGAEALWFDGNYFSWGYGGNANYFADNVGIGTTSPAYKLDVNGNAKVTDLTLLDPNEPVLRLQHSGRTWGTDSGGFIEFYDNSARGGWLGYGGGYDGNLYLTNQLTGKGIKFKTQDTDRMTIDSAGNVGIGTTAPTTNLDVNGQIRIRGGSPVAGKVLTSDATGLATWQAATGGGIGGSGTTNYLPIFTGTSSIGNSVVYQSGSNIGIGTTSPAAKLDIRGDEVRIWDGSASVGSATGAGDLYVEDTLEVDNQICFNGTCRTTWPNVGLSSYTTSCSQSASFCCTASCGSGYALTSWTCSSMRASCSQGSSSGQVCCTTTTGCSGSGTCTNGP